MVIYSSYRKISILYKSIIKKSSWINKISWCSKQNQPSRMHNQDSWVNICLLLLVTLRMSPTWVLSSSVRSLVAKIPSTQKLYNSSRQKVIEMQIKCKLKSHPLHFSAFSPSHQPGVKNRLISCAVLTAIKEFLSYTIKHPD